MAIPNILTFSVSTSMTFDHDWVPRVDSDWDDPACLAAVDAELLTKALEYITAHPEEWDQRSWARRYAGSCGTTACLGGTTVTLAGYDIVWDEEYASREDDGSLTANFTTTGESIETLAMELLGLTDDAAEYLFHYYGDRIEVLWRRAAEVSGGRVTVPVEFTR